MLARRLSRTRSHSLSPPSHTPSHSHSPPADTIRGLCPSIFEDSSHAVFIITAQTHFAFGSLRTTGVRQESRQGLSNAALAFGSLAHQIPPPALLLARRRLALHPPRPPPAPAPCTSCPCSLLYVCMLRELRKPRLWKTLTYPYPNLVCANGRSLRL